MQVLSWLGAAILLIGAFLMGTVILAVALGVALILGLYIAVRVWWIRRRLAAMAREERAASAAEGGAHRNRDGSSRVIDVEYTEVDRRDDDGG